MYNGQTVYIGGVAYTLQPADSPSFDYTGFSTTPAFTQQSVGGGGYYSISYESDSSFYSTFTPTADTTDA